MKFMSIFSRAKSIAAITAVSIGLTICFFVIDIPILHIFELKLYDLRVQKRGLQQPAPVVALAMIDEKSLDREGRWPWPRSKIATLIERLSEGGAKVIGFDIGFLEPEDKGQLATVGDATVGDGDDLMRFSHGYGISNSAISFSPRATARLIADCPTPKSFPTAVPSMPNFLTAR
jgi:hypothetical protein